jgi:hypothetical protein
MYVCNAWVGGDQLSATSTPHLEQKEKTEKKKNATRRTELRSEQC